MKTTTRKKGGSSFRAPTHSKTSGKPQRASISSLGPEWTLLHEIPGKKTYLNKVSKTLMKVYPAETPTEYLQLESLLLKAVETKKINSCRVQLHSGYRALPTEGKAGALAIERPAGISTLQEQLEVLGKKRDFNLDIIWNIVSDVAEGIKDIQESQNIYLALKPENVIFKENGSYMLADLVFNEYTVATVRREDELEDKKKLEVFPHMNGKTEHTLVIFHEDRNEYINSKIEGTREAVSQETKKKRVNLWSPYLAPEVLETPFSTSNANDSSVKADSFSIGVSRFLFQMLFLKMLCILSETSFDSMAQLNLQKSHHDFNECLYEIVKFGERYSFEKELGIIVQLLMLDPVNRPSPDKLFYMIQNDHL